MRARTHRHAVVKYDALHVARSVGAPYTVPCICLVTGWNSSLQRGFPVLRPPPPPSECKMAEFLAGVKSFLSGLADALSGLVPIIMLAQG